MNAEEILNLKCVLKIPLQFLTFLRIPSASTRAIWIIKWEASAYRVHKIPSLCKWSVEAEGHKGVSHLFESNAWGDRHRVAVRMLCVTSTDLF